MPKNEAPKKTRTRKKKVVMPLVLLPSTFAAIERMTPEKKAHFERVLALRSQSKPGPFNVVAELRKMRGND